jgi:hypothetical protein
MLESMGSSNSMMSKISLKLSVTYSVVECSGTYSGLAVAVAPKEQDVVQT